MTQHSATEHDAPAGVVLQRGQTVSRFVVLGLVGRGAMGEVYAAYDPELDRKVAIKLLRARGGAGGEQRLRLLREAQAIAKLQHPNVVVVFDVGTYGESVFIAMEYVEGQTVTAWLQASARTRREILDVYMAAGRGLAAAHAVGLVHRDFKPDNVMVTADGQVRVMDFGLARHVDDDHAAQAADVSVSASRLLSVKVTQTGALLGTPAYMAPEQFEGAVTEARTDQFSFCVALFEALTGVRPFAGDTFLAIMTNVTTGTLSPPPPKAALPTWLRKVLQRGLATKPEARFPSMNALLASVQKDPTVRTRRVLFWGLGLAVLAVATVVAVRRGAQMRRPLCGGGAERLAGSWGSPGAPSARRTAIERAFQATNDPFAAKTFVTVSRYLDEYAATWLAAHADACEATHVRGEQSGDVLDLRMGCLNDRLLELRALTDELTIADAKVVQNAVSGVSALGPISRCSDVRLLRTVVRPPSDEPTKKRVEVLQGLKAKLFASTLSGRCKTTRKIEEEVLSAARAVKYPPLLAETLLACGKVEDTCGARGETLSRYYQEAFTVALASGHDQVAAESATFLASTRADREQQISSAREWHAIGRAIVARMGPTPHLEIALDQAEGVIAQHQGDEAGSLAALERARLGTAKLRGAEHPYVAIILNAEALTMHHAGRHERALEVLRRAEVILWNVVGSDHPWVAMVLANEGDVLNALYRYVEARAAFEMATMIWNKEQAEAARMASSQMGLGIACLGVSRPLDAIVPLERALAARADKTTPPARIGEARFALARAVWANPATRGRALALARAARNDYAAVADEEGASMTRTIDAWLRAPSSRL